MALDGVLGAVHLPTDGWLDPSGLAQALAAGARKRGARIETHSRVVGIDVERRPGPRRAGAGQRRPGADDRGRGRRQRRGHVRAGDRPAGRGQRADRADGPRVPVHRADRRGRPRACRRCATRTTSSTSARRSAACAWAATSATRRRGRSTGIPADFNGKLLAPDWPRFAEIMDGAVRRVPAIADAGVNRMINGPEAFTPDNEFILGESEVRGFFVAAGFCAHGIAGAGGIGRQVRQLDRRRRARARPVEDGHPAVRRPVPQPGLHPGPDGRGLLDLLRHPLSQRGAPGRSAVAAVAGVRPAGRARCGLRREVRLGAAELVRIERRRGRRGAAAAVAGPASTGRRRSARRRSRRAPPRASSTSRASARSRSPDPAPARSCSGCAPTTSTGRSARSSTPRCSTGAAESRPTSPSPGWRTSAS